MNSQKSAMFGLDARIALAIFGALSVITGVALYSALENAEVTKIINEMNEVGKAFVQYNIDTRRPVPQYSTNKSILLIPYLTEDKGVKGWKGPYLSRKGVSVTAVKQANGIDSMWLRVGTTNDTWGGAIDFPAYTGTDCPNKPCGIWVQFSIDSYNIVDAIDKKIDGESGRNKGKVRVKNKGVNSSPAPNVFLLVEPSLYP